MVVNGAPFSDSGVRDLTKVHNFLKELIQVKQDEALQGLVLLPAGSSLIENRRD